MNKISRQNISIGTCLTEACDMEKLFSDQLNDSKWLTKNSTFYFMPATFNSNKITLLLDMKTKSFEFQF